MAASTLESRPLLGEEPELVTPERQRTVRAARRFVAAAMITLTAVAGTFMIGFNLNDGSESTINSGELDFEHWNQYTEKGESVGGNAASLLPWKHLVEPFRPTTFQAKVIQGSAEGTFEWEVRYTKKIRQEGDRVSGETVEHTFTAVGLHGVTLLQTQPDGTQRLFADEVMCKYVRREIRRLRATDRLAFFDALTIVYRTDIEEGRALYGPKFKDITYLVRKHLYGAASKDCDHWHDGAGIMTHHMAFTLEMEQSLQAINPAVAMPYWEYTLDAYVFGSDWLSSPIFHADWFGEASPSNDHHFVTEGRWAYTTVMKDARNFSGVTNPWGLLRSPWNTNPTPYVTRHNKVFGETLEPTFPGCNSFDSVYSESKLSVVTELLNGAAHGPVHILMGGQWGGKYADFLASFIDSSDIDDVLLLSKWLWRKGYVRCPDSCDLAEKEDGGEQEDICSCGCPAEIIGDDDAYTVLDDRTHVVHWLALAVEYDGKSDFMYYNASEGRYRIHDYTEEKEAVFWDTMLKALCEVGHPGEMFTSAAPYDPIFWPVHAAADRLLSWKRLLNELGLSWFNETWKYDHYMSPGVTPPSDTGEVCDWSQVQDGTLDMPTCTKAICPGHLAQDYIPFSDFLLQGDEAVDATEDYTVYTNEDFYRFMSPTNPDLPYIYDNFRWKHCEEDGYTFYPTNMSWLVEDKYPYESISAQQLARTFN